MSETLELCIECDQPTGRAGIAEDSLYTSYGDGPYCEECWTEAFFGKVTKGPSEQEQP